MNLFEMEGFNVTFLPLSEGGNGKSGPRVYLFCPRAGVRPLNKINLPNFFLSLIGGPYPGRLENSWRIIWGKWYKHYHTIGTRHPNREIHKQRTRNPRSSFCCGLRNLVVVAPRGHPSFKRLRNVVALSSRFSGLRKVIALSIRFSGLRKVIALSSCCWGTFFQYGQVSNKSRKG